MQADLRSFDWSLNEASEACKTIEDVIDVVKRFLEPSDSGESGDAASISANHLQKVGIDLASLETAKMSAATVLVVRGITLCSSADELELGDPTTCPAAAAHHAATMLSFMKLLDAIKQAGLRLLEEESIQTLMDVDASHDMQQRCVTCFSGAGARLTPIQKAITYSKFGARCIKAGAGVVCSHLDLCCFCSKGSHWLAAALSLQPVAFGFTQRSALLVTPRTSLFASRREQRLWLSTNGPSQCCLRWLICMQEHSQLRGSGTRTTCPSLRRSQPT